MAIIIHSDATLLPQLTKETSERERQRLTLGMAAEAKMDGNEPNKDVEDFYDTSAGVWEDIWGDHMHQGYFDPDSTVSVSDFRAAQDRLIHEALRFAGISADSAERPKSIVDVGCGMGGTSTYLARHLGAKCIGIDLSHFVIQRATALAAAQGLADKVSFQVADASEQPFPDGKFDLVLSIACSEHMPDKAKFINELARVAAPGGKIIILTWCHRDLAPGESFQPWEKDLLEKIRNANHLPAWISSADYVKIMQSASLQDIKAADWSPYIAPFWPAAKRAAFSWKGLTAVLRWGLKAIKGWWQIMSMYEGYKKGVLKETIITCRKPE